MEKSPEGIKELLYKNSTLAMLFFKLKNNIYLFTRKKLAERLITEEIKLNDLLKELESIRKLLVTLRNKNESKNLKYIEDFSKTWDSFKKTCSPINKTTDNNSIIELKILSLIKNVENFPKTEDLTLGYYLSEYNKENWAPFPFMDILETLHNEEQNPLKKGILTYWITLTEELSEELSF